MSQIGHDVWLTLIGAVFIALGSPFIWVAIRKVREDRDSRRWPQTLATLKDIEVIKRIREEGAEKNFVQYVSYFCDLTYDYRVGERDFTAQTQVTAGNREEAVRMAAGHKKGDTRPIHYNPDQPDRYRFALASPFAGFLWLLPFAGLAGFGCAIIYVGRSFYGS